VVARTGIMLVWRGAWLKRVLMFATIPALIAMFGVGLFEQGIKDDAYRAMFNQFLEARSRNFGPQSPSESFREIIFDAPNQRHVAWSNILLWYFRYPQAFWIVAVVGLVAPRLISYDLRSRGYLLYLSRPLSPASYVFGKACILFFLLAMITTVPALAVYAGGLLLTNDFSSILQTWDIPFRILLATAVLVLPTSAVALAFSSLTQESRFAAFAWFAMWIVGWVTYLVLTGTAFMNPSQMSQVEQLERRWILISPYHVLGHLQQEIFGLIPKDEHMLGPWIVCLLTTIAGFAIAHRRVARMLKV
jgi:ABC-2 type transport system permease protein